MEFEWDPAKANGNLAKHGVDFGGATRVFDDSNVLTDADPRIYSETRFRAIGLVRGSVVAETFTNRLAFADGLAADLQTEFAYPI